MAEAELPPIPISTEHRKVWDAFYGLDAPIRNMQKALGITPKHMLLAHRDEPIAFNPEKPNNPHTAHISHYDICGIGAPMNGVESLDAAVLKEQLEIAGIEFVVENNTDGTLKFRLPTEGLTAQQLTNFGKNLDEEWIEAFKAAQIANYNALTDAMKNRVSILAAAQLAKELRQSLGPDDARLLQRKGVIASDRELLVKLRKTPLSTIAALAGPQVLKARGQ